MWYKFSFVAIKRFQILQYNDILENYSNNQKQRVAEVNIFFNPSVRQFVSPPFLVKSTSQYFIKRIYWNFVADQNVRNPYDRPNAPS